MDARARSIFALLAGPAGLACAPAAAQSFQGLGFPGDALGVSADGNYVVGGAAAGAFRWSSAGGVEYLGQPAGSSTAAFATNADGSVAVGSVEGSGAAHVFRWASGVFTDLGAGPGTVARAFGVSAAGDVVSGYTNGSVFRWTQATGFVLLGTGSGYQCSADGGVVIGGHFFGGASSHAFRWTQGTGMQDLGVLAGGPLSVAYAVSLDGTTVVGMSYAGPTSPTDYRPFRWRAGTGMVNLGLPPGAQYTWGAEATSGDGSVVVGKNWMGDRYAAFIWTQATGIQDLQAYLGGLGISTVGWTLSDATGVSGDGSVIVGQGTGPGGYQGWIAHLGGGSTCYANCDHSTTVPFLNVADFTCFLQRFAAADAYANCDASTTPPVLNVADFTCFLQKFAAGCSAP